MIQRRTTAPGEFSPLTTWIGIVILGSALASAVVPPALANATAFSTSTISWPTSQMADGIISGGAPRDYLTGTEGWGLAPFSSLGASGMEWSSQWDPAHREPFYGTVQASSINPGGVSTWSTAGLISPLPDYNFVSRIAHRLEHNQMAWTIDMTVLDEDALVPNRFFWIADLAPGYQAVYSSPGPGQLIISDASKTHPTLVFSATTTAGTLQWAGSAMYSQALIDGEQAPTLYVYGTTARELKISISLGIIDHDPCSAEAARAFAALNTTAPATAWPSITQCMGDVAWALEANDSTSLNIPLDPNTPALGADQGRSLSISGLPEGVSWEPIATDASGITVRLSATDAVTPGDYPLALDAWTTTTTGGVVKRSQPLRSTGLLRIDPAPVIIEEPEPEPEPVPTPDPTPDLEPEPEPEVVPEPEPEPEVVTEPVVVPDPEPVTDPAPSPEVEAESGPEENTVGEPAVLEPEQPAPLTEPLSDSVAVSVSESAPVPTATPAPALPESPTVIEVREGEPSGLPEPTFVPSEPVEIPLAPKEPRTSDAPVAVSPPEPVFAGAWLGLSLMISLVAGALIAAMRRWRNQLEE